MTGWVVIVDKGNFHHHHQIHHHNSTNSTIYISGDKPIKTVFMTSLFQIPCTKSNAIFMHTLIVLSQLFSAVLWHYLSSSFELSQYVCFSSSYFFVIILRSDTFLLRGPCLNHNIKPIPVTHQSLIIDITESYTV